jgi:glycerol-3-phosphate dehydrogenase (NAD(P)+)
MKISVLGSGGWGSALAKVLIDNDHEVTLWSKFEDEIQKIRDLGENPDKLPGIKLPESLILTSDIQVAIHGAHLIVIAVPSSFVRSTCELIKPYVLEDQLFVNVAKGIEDKTLMTLEELVLDVLPNNKVAVLSGPSHAEEVARGIPTSVVVGSKDKEIVKLIQDVFMNQNFRVYGTDDITGVEIGGALKNVIALAAGISDGLGFGDNTKAALMTRGISEISRLGMAMGANPMTFNGLSGIGDLIVTCTSMHSRNRRAGILIGQGKTLQEALDEVKMVVEGVYSAKAALNLAKKYEVELPIIEQVNRVLFEGADPAVAVDELMNRKKKFETHH